ncbi:MAG TPA: MqnA/MqnD/SBP family protein, partial [Phycisphaerales bacterium]|nr:MqnA/MqnD/SBP family protein [Phycisphaerales bacterium]
VTGMLDPAEPGRALSPPELRTGRFRFRAVPEDIQVLNRRALERGDLDVTALSVAVYPHVRARYALTSFGASMGEGYGPRLVVPAASPLTAVSDLVDPSLPRSSWPLVAIPGEQTTAYLALVLACGAPPRTVRVPFDRILEAVSRGEADAGLLIHQSQLTFAEANLRAVFDAGAWWTGQTGLPLPLGVNAVRRDLDARFGPGTCDEVVVLLARSLGHAIRHRERSLVYAMSFAPELSRGRAERYLAMYVSGLTRDAGEVGRRAIAELLGRGHAAGICPDPGVIELLRPAAPTGQSP